MNNERNIEFPAAFTGPGGTVESQKQKLKNMIKKGKSASMYGFPGRKILRGARG